MQKIPDETNDRRGFWKYFSADMNADEVRQRLYELLFVNRVSNDEIEAVKREHEIMCRITVDKEMKLATDGWLTE